MIIYQIKLPKKQDAEAFVAFMRDEYFPAVHKGATRVGEVTGLELLQAETDNGEAMHDFFLHVGWGGLAMGNTRVDDQAVQSKFTAFGAKMKRLGSFKEVASWNKGGAK